MSLAEQVEKETKEMLASGWQKHLRSLSREELITEIMRELIFLGIWSSTNDEAVRLFVRNYIEKNIDNWWDFIPFDISIHPNTETVGNVVVTLVGNKNEN